MRTKWCLHTTKNRILFPLAAILWDIASTMLTFNRCRFNGFSAKWRVALALSQEALADYAEIDRSHMGKIERGERNVTFLNIVRIAQAIQCRPSDLLLDANL